MAICRFPLLFVIFASLSALPSLVSASGCGIMPSSLSGQMVSCIPVNIVNGAGTATGSGLQVSFNNLPINAMAGNVVVYNGISGSLMPSWVESNSLLWVNLGSNTIGAGSSANGIYYIGIGNSGTNFFSAASANGIGEAPQLSGTYGQYDNGNVVFNSYWGFPGTNTPTGITISGSASINNGGKIPAGTSQGTIATSASTYSASLITEDYGIMPPTATTSGYTEPILIGGSVVGCSSAGTGIFTVLSGMSLRSYSSSCNAGSTSSVSGSGSYYEWRINNTASNSNVYGSVNQGGTITSQSLSTQIYTGSGAISIVSDYGGTTSGVSYTVYWLRQRGYPPSGVMPTVTYGASQGTTLSISPSNSLFYGTVPITITATCLSSTDTCDVDSPLGTHLAAGTGSATYTILSPLAVGAYTYYANDLTLSMTSSNTLTIIAYSCSYPPSALASSTLYFIPLDVAASSAANNAQLMLSFPASAYSSYLSGNLQNIYVYNGLGAYSVNAWIEGNILNEQQTTNLNTAADVVIWIEDPSANDMSTSSSTNYCIGVGSTGTNFLANANAKIGEAPQLSGTYGQYDNGASVFQLYNDFKSSYSGWNVNSGTTATASGGLALSLGGTPPAFGWLGASNAINQYPNLPFITEAYMEQTNAVDEIGFGGSVTSTPASSTDQFNPAMLESDNSGVAAWYYGETSAWIAPIASGISQSTFYIWQLAATSSAQIGSLITTSYASPVITHTEAAEILSPFYVTLGGGAAGATSLTYWVRTRTYPPGGVMPTAIYGAMNLFSLGVVTSPATATVYQGQSGTITGTVTGGTSPYT